MHRPERVIDALRDVYDPLLRRPGDQKVSSTWAWWRDVRVDGSHVQG